MTLALHMELQPISQETVEATARLLGDLSVSFAGVLSTSMRRAICRDGIKDPDLIVLLARQEQEIAGVVIAILNHVVFWKRFSTRHPLLAARILSGRLAPAGPAHASQPADGTQPLESPLESWADAGPDIAKISFIGVAAAHRRRGVGEALYAGLFEHLSKRAVKRVDARIDEGNHPSIRLHQASGWKLRRDSHGVFAVRSLP
jgi:ribosomal protein S18 acetylase RimI-like enzyme